MILGSKWSIPDNWAWSKFNEIAEINPKLPFHEINDELNVSFIPMKNVEEKTGKIDLSIIRPYKEVKKGYTKFIDNDIIFAKITPCMENGKIAIINNLHNRIGFGSTEFHVIRLYNDLSRNFFFYYLLQDSFRNLAARNFTGTVGQRRVPADFMKEGYVPLPPINEQVHIVSKIEELFSRLDQGVNALQQTQHQLEQYRQSTLKQAFTGKLTQKWRNEHSHELAHIKDVLENIEVNKKYQKLDEVNTSNYDSLPDLWKYARIGNISKNIHYGYTEKAVKECIGPKFLRITDIQNDAVDWNKVPYCKIEEDKISKYLLKKGDILFARTGATVGKSYLIQQNIQESVFASYLIRLILSKKINIKYVYYYFKSPFYWRQIIENKVGVGQPNVNATKLSELIIPIAPVLEQTQIINLLDRIFSVFLKTKESIVKESARTEKMKQSILKIAFKGHLVPRSPDDEPASVLLERIKTEKDKVMPLHRRVRRRKAQGEFTFQMTPVRRGTTKRERSC